MHGTGARLSFAMQTWPSPLLVPKVAAIAASLESGTFAPSFPSSQSTSFQCQFGAISHEKMQKDAE